MNEARLTICAIKAKHWVLRHYLWVTLTLLLLALAVASLLRPETWEEWAAIIGVPVAFLVASQKQKTEELRLFKELFTEFNERYDRMNKRLYDIPTEPEDLPLSPDERNVLFDYFNLCGEEYLFYEQGYIYPRVWVAWRNGMQIFFFHNPRIKKLWVEELKTGSYYGLTVDEIVKQDGQSSTRKDDDKPSDGTDSSLRDAA